MSILSFYNYLYLSFGLFVGELPPLDHTVKIHIAKSLSASVIAFMWSFACFGLIIACFFLYFNVKYRENRFESISNRCISSQSRYIPGYNC